MPQIKEYQAQVNPQENMPTRIVRAGEFDGPGQGLSDLGQGIENYQNTEKEIDQRNEVSTMATGMAQARSELTVSLAQQAETATPGDPNFAQRFNEQVDKYIGKMGEGLTTPGAQRAYARESANLKADLSQAAGMFAVKSAGVKAVNDYQNQVDFNRNTLLADPAQFQGVLKSTEDALADQHGSYALIPADKRAQLERTTKEALAKSAVEGLIRQNPKYALAQLNSGSWDQYLGPDNKNTLLNNIATAMTAQEVQASRADRLNEKAKEQAAQASLDASISRLVADPKSVNASDIANDPHMKPTQKLEMLGKLREGFFDAPPHAPTAAMADVMRRVHLPDGAPGKIVDEDQLISMLGGPNGLSPADLKTARGYIQDARKDSGEDLLVKNFIQMAEKRLTARAGGVMLDAKGDQHYSQFLSSFLPAYKQARESGTPVGDLLSPTGKHYMGNLIEASKRSGAQIAADLAHPAPVAAPAQPKKEQAVPGFTPMKMFKGRQIGVVGGKWVFPDGTAAQ